MIADIAVCAQYNVTATRVCVCVYDSHQATLTANGQNGRYEAEEERYCGPGRAGKQREGGGSSLLRSLSSSPPLLPFPPPPPLPLLCTVFTMPFQNKMSIKTSTTYQMFFFFIQLVLRLYETLCITFL